MTSQWDEPFERLDELAVDLLRVNPAMAVELNVIHLLLQGIRNESEQQAKDLDAIFSVLESIEGRNYSKAQEAIRDCDF
jgi:hypothetical protein